MEYITLTIKANKGTDGTASVTTIQLDPITGAILKCGSGSYKGDKIKSIELLEHVTSIINTCKEIEKANDRY